MVGVTSRIGMHGCQELDKDRNRQEKSKRKPEKMR